LGIGKEGYRIKLGLVKKGVNRRLKIKRGLIGSGGERNEKEKFDGKGGKVRNLR